MATLGTDIPMERGGQPFEIALAYVNLASNDSAYVTRQILHVNGGKIPLPPPLLSPPQPSSPS